MPTNSPNQKLTTTCVCDPPQSLYGEKLKTHLDQRQDNNRTKQHCENHPEKNTKIGPFFKSSLWGDSSYPLQADKIYYDQKKKKKKLLWQLKLT